MSRHLKVLAALVTAMAMAVFVAACGGDDSDSGSGDSGSSGGGKYAEIKKNPDNASKSVKIGSKNFAEQYVLAEIYAQALAAAGYKATTELDLGPEQVAHKALLAGDVDAYPEYTGTSLTSFFKVKTNDVPRDPQKAYAQAKADYAKQGITALPITKFENTYRVTTTPEKQKSDFGGATKLSEVTKDQAASKRLAGNPECRQRNDCYLGIQRVYGIKPKFVSTGQNYEALDKDQTDLIMAFSTDGQLNDAKKYAILEDDKKLFPPYQISLGIDTDKLKELGPDVESTVVNVQKGLTYKNIRNLNQRVSVNKEKPADVAKFYLESLGYVKKGGS